MKTQKNFFLVTWKQFENRKVSDKCEVISSESIDEDIEHMKTLNAQKRLTTAEYRHFNLDETLDKAALKIIEKTTKN